MEINEFLSGPFLCASLLVFFAGLIYKIVWYVRGLDWRLERVAYAYAGKNGWIGALHSAFKWLIPFGTHSWRNQIYFTFAFFFFHLGVVVAPLFCDGHLVIMKDIIGFSWCSLPSCVIDSLTILGIIGAIMLLLRRILIEQVRFISNFTDYSLLILCIILLESALMARFQIGGGYMTTIHMLCGNLILIIAPFTKMSHIVLYFMSRGQLGMDFAVKRGGATRGSKFPW